jgi:hypothetical protein
MTDALCTDCRDAALTTAQEQAHRLCSTCLADQLAGDE